MSLINAPSIDSPFGGAHAGSVEANDIFWAALDGALPALDVGTDGSAWSATSTTREERAHLLIGRRNRPPTPRRDQLLSSA